MLKNTVHLSELKEHILSVLKGGDILFIVSPFNSIESTLLGVHHLQSLAEERGYKTEILYLNLLLASVIGVETHENITLPPFEFTWTMLHERLFARSAYGLSPLGKLPGYHLDERVSISESLSYHNMSHESEDFDLDGYREVEKMCCSFVDEVTPVIASLNYKMIGCTIRMGQTNCSIALLDGIKRIQPGIVTLIGGANCQGEMAQGIASLSKTIDYIFSGESEVSFCNFLERYSIGELPSERIIYGQPLRDLDSLPLPGYQCFFVQNQHFLGEHPKPLAVSYETSRGCWWGEKQKCRFCGNEVNYRKKTTEKILNDLTQLSQCYPDKTIYMCDNIMPISFTKEVLPALKEKKNAPPIYYMLKADINLKDLVNLKMAKVDQMTCGIEALSTGLLKLMNKGSSARQNLQLLRYTRSIGIHVDWLLLWGFPGDKALHYIETLKILPLIRHFPPPINLIHLNIARFSSYFEKARDFHINNIRPWAVYNMIYPRWAEKDKLAYWFAGDYPCEAHENPQLIKKIAAEVVLWKKAWETTHLVMIPFEDYYLIFDNRDGKGKKQEVLDHNEAKEVMTTCRYNEFQYQEWALEKKLAVLVDSWYVPLVTASPELLLQWEE
jgi:ribosomal peptide maturation radical SAM protein 1